MLLVSTLRFPLVVKAFPQTEHLKGLSPVCVRMWICRADPEEKFFLHTWHRCLLPGPPPPLLRSKLVLVLVMVEVRLRGGCDRLMAREDGEEEEEGSIPASKRPVVSFELSQTTSLLVSVMYLQL